MFSIFKKKKLLKHIVLSPLPRSWFSYHWALRCAPEHKHKAGCGDPWCPLTTFHHLPQYHLVTSAICKGTMHNLGFRVVVIILQASSTSICWCYWLNKRFMRQKIYFSKCCCATYNLINFTLASWVYLETKYIMSQLAFLLLA